MRAFSLRRSAVRAVRMVGNCQAFKQAELLDTRIKHGPNVYNLVIHLVDF
ncbi:hypothetical protein IMCC21224_113866 [Puniceibacterium sp. IMCC21224]|nr:hypothetical protein IMCC21224_113866 [Puniceibacterium sp. IMCC21224]